ncbi:Hypothetical predicted protein [Mytilus galloprovincialis]|uniref:PH domain-containing protein n=1 Tax=Mytilus galloprovincialis TaxID=29158 RepID=A0A8B6FUW1_MYTGA|nr:Hypothetical predicted protein [Mytilus galloprovincialis]
MVLIMCKQAQESSDVRTALKKGTLTMVQSVNNQLVKFPMVVQVYKTRFEHYAVIHRDMKFTNTAVYMNLKKCQVRKRGTNEITLIADNIEGNSLTFLTRNIAEVESWIGVFKPSSNVTIKRDKHLPKNNMHSMSLLKEEEEECIDS